MKYLFVGIAVLLVSCKMTKLPVKADQELILEKLYEQEAKWNNANLDEFMEAYIKSDSLKFIGRNGVNYGWVNVLNNYRNHYSNPEKMGKLDFEVIHLDPLGPLAYLMIGSYQLTFSTGAAPQKGYFTIIWQKIEGGWFITSDHTS